MSSTESKQSSQISHCDKKPQKADPSGFLIIKLGAKNQTNQRGAFLAT